MFRFGIRADKYHEFMFLVLTHLAPVWTGPKPFTAVYSLKYCGIEKPMKIEKAKMNFVLKLFKLQNWMKLRPPTPVHAHI